MTDELVAWLSAQIDADEKRETGWYTVRVDPGLELFCALCGRTSQGTHHESGRSDVGLDCGHYMSGDEYRDRYLVPKPPDPRAMAEIALKRTLLDAHTPVDGWHGVPDYGPVCQQCASGNNAGELEGDPYPCAELRHLAAVYADRDGYKESWRP